MANNVENILTVIIPVYNDACNITRCLDSLFNQTWKSFEVIVIDDASTDNTLDVLKEYKKSHDIKIFSMATNSGAGSCRNLGLSYATTQYITFIDSDDWIDLCTYEKCLQGRIDQPDLIIYGLIYDYIQFDYKEVKYKYRYNYILSGDIALKIYSNMIHDEIKITPIVNNKIYNLQFLLKNSLCFPSNIRYQEDDVFTFEVLSKAKEVVIVNDGCYHYCQNPNSLIHKVSVSAILDFISAYSILKEYLQDNSLFDKYKTAFYLKLKGSLQGVINRIIDYEPDLVTRCHLLSVLYYNFGKAFNLDEFLMFLNFSKIRRIL